MNCGGPAVFKLQCFFSAPRGLINCVGIFNPNLALLCIISHPVHGGKIVLTYMTSNKIHQNQSLHVGSVRFREIVFVYFHFILKLYCATNYQYMLNEPKLCTPENTPALPSPIYVISIEQCSKPLLVDDYRGLYYPIYWGL